MIPIWAKDEEGKWQLFPAHLLETFADGRQGFVFEVNDVWQQRTEAFLQFRHCFEDYPRNEHHTVLRFRYCLKKQFTNE